jgi:Zn-dependent oligopeptidase
MGMISSPEDFSTVAKEAIYNCNALRAKICEIDISSRIATKTDVSTAAATAKDILALYDSISNIICSVIDSTELCRNVHTDPEYREKSEESFAVLSEYISELNSDEKMYNQLKSLRSIVHESGTNKLSLSSEDIIFMDDMIREYESDGIHLQSRQDRNRVTELQQTILTQESKYMQSASNDFKTFTFGPMASIDEHTRLRRWLGQYIPENYADTSEKLVGRDKYLICTSNKGH